MGVIARIRGLVAVKPVPLWTSEYIQVPSSANLADVIFDAGDAIGPVSSFLIPKAGTLDFAKLYVRADLNTQFNIVLFWEKPAFPPVSDAVFALDDYDLLRKLHTLQFTVFEDFGTSHTSDLDHIGLHYSLPPYGASKKLALVYFQCYAIAAQTHVIGSENLFKLTILPDEPTPPA